ncbi:MAG: hypothetical protein AB1772_05410 [Candidatus Zixiibacteriota bacterium]
MKPIALALITIICLCLAPLAASAQTDRFGKPDTVYAEVSYIGEFTAAVTISYTNDETIVGLQIPFRMDAGLNKIVADSAVYTGGRIAAAKWAYTGFRPDTAIQCVMLGMIANLGPTDNKLTPGSGRIATVYISSLEDKKIEKLIVDSTTLAHGGGMMAIADMLQGNPPDSIRMPMSERQIKPVWVFRNAK